jgi:hypothetical protein
MLQIIIIFIFLRIRYGVELHLLCLSTSPIVGTQTSLQYTSILPCREVNPDRPARKLGHRFDNVTAAAIIIIQEQLQMLRIEHVKWLEAVPLHQRAFREQRRLPRVSRDHRALSCFCAHCCWLAAQTVCAVKSGLTKLSLNSQANKSNKKTLCPG